MDVLPARLLSLERTEGRATPRYLTARDEVWIRSVVDEFDGFVGRTVGERNERLPERIRALAREHGVRERVADGVATVLTRRYKSRVEAAVSPLDARRTSFACAAALIQPNRRSALTNASNELRAAPDAIGRSIFADRTIARMVIAPAPLSAADVVDAYNLALVQGLLLRSELVVVHVREHVRAVVRFAKLTGLLCTYSLDERGTRLDVSGPLSVLRHTTKYGFALATFFPAVLATPGFRMEARCVIGGEPVVVPIDASDRIARTHALPRDADSNVERALARDVRRLDRGWELIRESEAIPIGARVFFPDFTMRRGDDRILLEVVGFYTPEYLRSKLEALRAARVRRMIVCVDESLACADGEVPGRVLRFRKKIDAARLLDVADELVATPARDGDDGHPRDRERSTVLTPVDGWPP
jgi:predicted nuclease of restriction endonuclease-like RecB superfamily